MPADTLTQTIVIKQEIPIIFLQQYQDVDVSLYPQTIGGLIDILLEYQALNARHNEDKARIKALIE